MSALKGMWWAWKGKAYGNQVADLLGIHRGLYHGAMEEGGCQMHLIKLFQLKQEGHSLEDVALHSCDYLLSGLAKLEMRFGPQTQIGQARMKVGDYSQRFNKDL
ncbi:hypothetical protein NJH54_24900 [Pseudomonas asiatica]|uniref:hypothetical protein n=1 Tax=Pseudomonas asiatica TaxID=2219225 RepID=UPI00209B3B85|nr:hypothetical protein [Pseudomonas asiatica]MCO7527733.1 hypothetical protein [Pseudomonas asiatica]